MLYCLLPEGDPFLFKRVTTPARFKHDYPAVAKNLIETMNAHNAVGLAANQCGLDIRVFVMKHGNQTIACFEPEILEVSNEKCKLREGRVNC